MERLTKRDTDGQAMMDCQKCEADWTGKHGKPMADCTALYCRNRLKDRLAAYEDTGLTPAMCANYKTFEDEAISKGVTFKRIIALMEADRDGRLVVLPCKLGDKLYRVFAGEIFEYRVGSMKYFAIQGRWGIETYPFCPYVESSIGKTIFLTREEAEKALEAMKNE